MEKHINEATVLNQKIKEVLKVMNFNRVEFSESEVRFRFESIRGMLIMAQNDSTELLRLWNTHNAKP